METPYMFAAFGALAGQLLALLELKNIPRAQRPNLRDFWYWFPFLISPAIGAGLAFAYEASGVALQPLVSVNVGIAAPMILRSMAELKNPPSQPIDPGLGA